MAGCSRRYKTPHKADVQEIRSSKPNWTLLWPPELTTGANIAPHSPLFHPTMDRQEKWAPSQLRTIWKKRFKMVVVVFGRNLTQVFHSWKLINYSWDHIHIELMTDCLVILVFMWREKRARSNWWVMQYSGPGHAGAGSRVETPAWEWEWTLGWSVSPSLFPINVVNIHFMPETTNFVITWTSG